MAASIAGGGESCGKWASRNTPPSLPQPHIISWKSRGERPARYKELSPRRIVPVRVDGIGVVGLAEELVVEGVSMLLEKKEEEKDAIYHSLFTTGIKMYNTQSRLHIF